MNVMYDKKNNNLKRQGYYRHRPTKVVQIKGWNIKFRHRQSLGLGFGETTYLQLFGESSKNLRLSLCVLI